MVCWLLVTTLVVMENVVGGCEGTVVGESPLVGLVVGKEVVGRIVIGEEVGLGNGNPVGDSVNPVVLVGGPWKGKGCDCLKGNCAARFRRSFCFRSTSGFCFVRPTPTGADSAKRDIRRPTRRNKG